MLHTVLSLVAEEPEACALAATNCSALLTKQRTYNNFKGVKEGGEEDNITNGIELLGERDL